MLAYYTLLYVYTDDNFTKGQSFQMLYTQIGNDIGRDPVEYNSTFDVKLPNKGSKLKFGVLIHPPSI